MCSKLFDWPIPIIKDSTNNCKLKKKMVKRCFDACLGYDGALTTALCLIWDKITAAVIFLHYDDGEISIDQAALNHTSMTMKL